MKRDRQFHWAASSIRHLRMLRAMVSQCQGDVTSDCPILDALACAETDESVVGKLGAPAFGLGPCSSSPRPASFLRRPGFWTWCGNAPKDAGPVLPPHHIVTPREGALRSSFASVGAGGLNRPCAYLSGKTHPRSKVRCFLGRKPIASSQGAPRASPNMLRILIADDHDVIRSGLRSAIESQSNWEVVAEAGDGKEAITKAIETKPDIAVLDYSMPLINGC
jgi:response regulator receiver domain-containing protein